MIKFCKLKQEVHHKQKKYYNNENWQNEWCDKLKTLNVKGKSYLIEKCKFHDKNIKNKLKEEI